jgi:hypothetical protein
MKTLVVTSDNANELKVLKYLAEKMGMEAEVLSEEEKEDMGLLKALMEGKQNDHVSEDEELKALRKNELVYEFFHDNVLTVYIP